MPNPLRLSLIALCLVPLAGCGGSGSEGVSTTPAVPTPTPTATTNETLTNLVASQNFDTASATLTATFTDPRDVPSNVTTSQSSGFGNGVALAYDASSQSYTISINQGGISDSVTYSSTHLDNDPDRGFIEYERDASNGDDTTLLLRRTGSANSGTNLSYLSYGLWERDIDQAGNSDLERWAMFVYGLRTTASQLPTSGTARYSGTLDGLWTTAGASYRLSGTSALTADFAGNSVTGTLTATGTDRETGATVAMDTLSGTASISRTDASFTGSLAGTSGFSGAFNGGFFGPAATEAGGTFSVSRGTEQATGVFVAGQ